MTGSGAEDGFRLQTETAQDATRMRLCGDLSGPEAAQVREKLIELATAKPKRLLADLSQVSRITSSGLGALVAASLWAKKLGVAFALVASQPVRDALTAAKLEGYFELGESP